jgi:hypothetical protein
MIKVSITAGPVNDVTVCPRTRTLLPTLRIRTATSSAQLRRPERERFAPGPGCKKFRPGRYGRWL